MTPGVIVGNENQAQRGKFFEHTVLLSVQISYRTNSFEHSSVSSFVGAQLKSWGARAMISVWHGLCIAIIALIGITCVIVFILARKKRWEWARMNEGLSLWHLSAPARYVPSPIFLLSWRLLVGLFFGGYLVYAVVRKGPSHFIFMTITTIALDALYFLVVAFISIYHYIAPPIRCPPSSSTSSSTFRTRVFVELVAGSFAVLFAMALFIDVILWGLLYPLALHRGDPPALIQDKYLNIGSYIMHGGNLVAFLVEFLLHRLPVVRVHVFSQCLYIITYVVVVWLVVAFSDLPFPYVIMNLDSPVAPLWYSSIVVLVLVTFFSVYGLYRLKKLFVRSCRASSQDNLFWSNSAYDDVNGLYDAPKNQSQPRSPLYSTESSPLL